MDNETLLPCSTALDSCDLSIQRLRAELRDLAERVKAHTRDLERLRLSMHAQFDAAGAANQAAFAGLRRQIAEVRRDVGELESRR
jgi:chromosome segregation ATPase